MNDTKTIFARAWTTAGHSTLWNCKSTYCTVPYEYLPQVDIPADDFSWLDFVSPELRQIINDTSSLDSDCNEISSFENVVNEGLSLGLNLPQSFLSFLGNPALQRKVPTCTGCFLSISEHFIPIPEVEGHFLLRFMNDSQACALWYLWMNQNGNVGVVTSRYLLDPDIFTAMEYETIDEYGKVKRDDAFHESMLCADTFMEFLYRFWIENCIWYSFHKGLQPTPLQIEYQSQITKKL